MTKINLKSKTRDIVGKGIKRMRKEGLIPAVIYGHKVASQSLWVNFKEFGKVYKEAGESTIVELDIDEKKKVNVLIHDIQKNPITDNISHIDFFQIRMDEKIETEIPLEFTGEAPAVKELGGVLIKTTDAISIKCLPADLPKNIEVDISVLKTFDDNISIADLKISDKVQVLVDLKTIVASVAPPRSDEEMARLDEKVEEDVSKVEGVVKETDKREGDKAEGDKKKDAPAGGEATEATKEAGK